MAKILAISPHLDDAVLSYGGQLAALIGAGHQVTVFTVFAGSPVPPYSPVAAAFHKQWAVSGDPVAPRRDEDLRAQGILGTIALHGSFLDAIYRSDGAGGWLISTGEPTEYLGDEPGLVEEIASVISGLIHEHCPDRMVTCAAIGEHVDHRRARDAALRAARRNTVPVSLWDDFPYSTWAELVPALPAALEVSGPVAQPLTPSDWAARNRAIRCYESQLAMLEEDGIPLSEWFTDHCESQAARYGVTGVYEIVRQVLTK